MIVFSIHSGLARAVTLTIAFAFVGSFAIGPAEAQTGTLAEPFPEPSANAALHYQRALLHLSKLDDGTEALRVPIWKSLPVAVEKEMPADLTRLLAQGRFAVRAAASGSRTSRCNFGIDFSDLGSATQLPHVEGMVNLGRLLTLRGALAESQGQWEEALIIYFDGMRMGRHMTHQSTLLEALAGIEILRNNYFALARWSTRCPARLLVARSFGLMESMQGSLVNPSQTIAREASILTLEFDRLRDAYPDGDWARMVLESYGEESSGKNDEDRKRAIAVATERGVSKKAFDSSDAFHDYLSRLEATSNRFVESVAACMALPPQARARRGASINRKYAAVLPILSSDTLIDVEELGGLMSEHDADLILVRITLALAASKADGNYPSSLDEVAARFGGSVPADPYRQEPVVFETTDDGTEFSLEIQSLGSLPGTSFDSRDPKPAR